MLVYVSAQCFRFRTQDRKSLKKLTCRKTLNKQVEILCKRKEMMVFDFCEYVQENKLVLFYLKHILYSQHETYSYRLTS